MNKTNAGQFNFDRRKRKADYQIIDMCILFLSSSSTRPTNQQTNKPVGEKICGPSPNFVAMATRVGPTTFCMVPLNRSSPKTP